MSTFTFHIDVPIRSEWSNIDLLFTSVKTCFAAMLADVDGCHTIAMVTSELLENAIKYGDWSGKERSFRFHVSGEGRQAQVSVHGPVKDPAAALASIESTLRWIKTFPSAEAAYHARLVEISEAAPGGSSRLGLARLAFQAGCTLRAERDAQGVKVIADLTM